MSVILEVIRPARHARPKRAPMLRVQCACGRIYPTTCWEREAREQRGCKVCRPGAATAATAVNAMPEEGRLP